MITLHYFPSNASLAPHVLLRELGIEFELKLVDRANQEHKSADYLKLNPNGLIPVLVQGDLVLYETAAILLHLADTHPDAALAPALATPARAHFYKWLFWLSNTMQATMPYYFYSPRMVDEGDANAAAQVRRHAERRLAQCLQQLDDLLASHGGPWLLGDAYRAADPLAFTLCRWTRGFAHERPARDLPHLGPYLHRLLERPAVRKAIEVEKLPEPWI